MECNTLIPRKSDDSWWFRFDTKWNPRLWIQRRGSIFQSNCWIQSERQSTWSWLLSPKRHQSQNCLCFIKRHFFFWLVKTTAKKTHTQPTEVVFLEEVCQQNAVVEGQEPERVSTDTNLHSSWIFGGDELHPFFCQATFLESGDLGDQHKNGQSPYWNFGEKTAWLFRKIASVCFTRLAIIPLI